MLGLIFLITGFLLVPSVAFAWGPMTHVFLGSEIFYFGSLIPPAIYALIKKYRSDYLYGNLMADSVIGKKYISNDRHPHNWDIGVSLLEAASTESERAFSLGYMSHLAADTVAHGRYTSGMDNMGHTLLELRADSVIDRDYWVQAVAIDRKVQVRNDAFLGKYLEMFLFSFKTNRRIFKSMVVLSGFNLNGIPGMVTRNLMSIASRDRLERLHGLSIDRMVDVLSHGTRSEVLLKDPVARSGRPVSPTG